MADYTGEREDWQVMQGNDFKNLYGNRDKVDTVSKKAKFLFSEVVDRDLLVGVSMVQIESGSCEFLINKECQAQSKYAIESIYNDQRQLNYLWEIVSGNVYFVSDSTGSECTVSSYLSSIDEIFVLKCSVVKDGIAQVLLSQTYTHTKTQI